MDDLAKLTLNGEDCRFATADTRQGVVMNDIVY
jgi:hypothetical protein